VTIDPGAPGPLLAPLMNGNNVKAWGTGTGELVWDTNRQAFREEALARLAPLGARVLRFPGGSKAEEYDWKAAVGPKRGGAGSRWSFGTDEFLELCRRLGAVPLITVNGGAGAQAAAEWVEYVNGAAGTPMGKLRAENGHPEPYGVRYWEIGNENYVSMKARDYAALVLVFAKAMKAADPSILVGGVGWAWPGWKSHYTKDTDPWNETVLAIAGPYLDAFIIHAYCWIDPKPAPEQRTPGLMRTVLGWPPQMARELAEVRASFAAAGRAGLPIWLTEFNGYYGEGGMCRPLGHTINGVLVASMMNEFARLGLPIVCYWDLATSGWGRFSALAHPSENQWLYRPSWQVLSLYARTLSGRLLPCAVQGPTFDHDKYSIVKAGSGTPGLDVVAAREGRTLSILLVNKLEGELEVAVDLAGPARPRHLLQSTFSGEQVWGEKCGVSETTNLNPGPLRFQLPGCSVTSLVAQLDR